MAIGPQVPQRQAVMVREYLTSAEYQRDANRLAVEGWRVTETTHGRTTHNIFQLWWRGRLFARRERIIVTYTRP